MPSVVEFNFVDSKSGKITFTPPSFYMAATGYGNCQTGQDTSSGQKWRAFFNFNTSSLPDNALITKVEFLVRLNTAQPNGEPDTTYIKFSIGTFIGAALNGTSAEFEGGTLMVTLPVEPNDNTWLDLNQDSQHPENYVKRAGDTDIKVWDDSIQGGGDSYWGLNFNTAKAKCKLRITYTVPSATATGRGTASVSATVAAAGSAMATGRGTAEGSGKVASRGAATATGRGVVQATAAVAAMGSSISTGRGTAESTAAVTTFGSSTATGRGLIELTAIVIATAGAMATGRGTVVVTATVVIHAFASATGRGTASCDGQAQGPTASATATGRGFAICRLTAVYLEPIARHSGSRTVRATHAVVRAVSPIHARTCVAGRMN